MTSEMNWDAKSPTATKPNCSVRKGRLELYKAHIPTRAAKRMAVREACALKIV